MLPTIALALLLAVLASVGAVAQVRDLGANLERVDYPYAVRWFNTRSQGAPVRMAYMDIAPPAAANGRTAVLMHGKNLCGASWGETARALASRGYRVIVPDQVGFCKSSKPSGYQYSLAGLASLTKRLLDEAGIERPTLVAHSTGGLIARCATRSCSRSGCHAWSWSTPLGLNDPLAEGAPYSDLDVLRAEEARTTVATIKEYQLRTYYHGQWRPEYDVWVDMLAGQHEGADGDVVRDAQARLSEMIETQPVASEVPRIASPTSLIIGQADTTAFRASSAPAASRDRIRTVPRAAEAAVRRFPDARLIRLQGVGHSPQIEAPAEFQRLLLADLDRPASSPTTPRRRADGKTRSRVSQ